MSIFLPQSPRHIINTENEMISLLSGANRITAIVAYWSLTNNSALANRLIHMSKIDKIEIELIVDISKPTNIDVIEELSEAGIRVFIFLGRKIQGAKKLLHSKIWHVEKNGGSNILLGSHNITLSSVTGQNIETSVIIEASSTDRDYFNTLYDCIFKSSELFESSKKKFFIALQHDISLLIEEKVFDVFTDRVSNINKGFVLYLFSNEQSIDISNNDYIRVVGQLDKKFKIFKVRTFNEGNVFQSLNESSDISFGDNRNFVWMDVGLIALMLNTEIQTLGKEQLKRSKSYLALEFIEEFDPKHFVVPKSYRPLWNSENLMHKRLNDAFSGQLDDIETGDIKAYDDWSYFLKSYLVGKDSFNLTNNEFYLENRDTFNEENYNRLRELYISYTEMINKDRDHSESYKEFIKSYNQLVNSMLNFNTRRLRKYKSSYKIHRMKDKDALMKIYTDFFKP